MSEGQGAGIFGRGLMSGLSRWRDSGHPERAAKTAGGPGEFDAGADALLRNIFAGPPEPGPPYIHAYTPGMQRDWVKSADWLRRKIAERRYLAEHAIDLGNSPEWRELSSGVLLTVADDAPQDGWDGFYALGDSSVTRLMEANDPRDTIARCDSELAILAEHAAVADHGRYSDRGEACDDDCGCGDRPPVCRSCRSYAGDPAGAPCPTVCLLAPAYRHHDGYIEHWGPAASYTVTQAGPATGAGADH